MIQLNQLLKWSGIIETGGQTVFLLDEEKILLNGVPVHEKRKKIYPGSHVILADQLEIEVVAARDEDHKPEAH